MSDAIATGPATDLLTPEERKYVDEVPEAELRQHLAHQTRLLRIQRNQVAAHEQQLTKREDEIRELRAKTADYDVRVEEEEAKAARRAERADDET